MLKGMNKVYLAIAALAILSMVILACGDDEPEPTPAPAPTAEPVDVTALANQMAGLLQQTLQAELAQMQPPLSEDAIRELIEGAISESAPEGISGAELQAMVDSAVAAAAAEGVNQEDVTAAIGAALAEAARNQPEPLSQADVERIVRAAVATPVPTAMPTPAPTVAPTPTPAATTAPMIPVDPRLKVAMVPPGHQVTMMYRTFQSSTGPQKAMYEHLIYKDRYTGEFTNEQLATEWSLTPDGTTWSAKLREGVPFHHTGTEFTAKDVVHTVQVLARDDSLASAAIWRDLGVAESNFEIASDHEITWNLDKPEPLIDFWMAEEWVAGIISKDYTDLVGLDGYHERPIGTGPFRFVELVIDSHILHERVEDHWRKTPEFHELQFYYIKEDSTRLAKLLTREVALADVPRTQLPEAVQRGLQVATSTLPGFYIYAFIGGQYYDQETTVLTGAREGEIEPIASGYSADDPLRDPRVREALNIAINRDAIRKAFWGDAAIPQAIHNVPPYRFDCKDEWFPYPGPNGGTGCADNGYPYPYDPDRAKELLTEAGYPEGFDFRLMMAPNMAGVPEGPDVGQAIHSDWGAIGLSAEIVEVEFAEVLRLQRERDMGRTVFMMRYATGPAPLGWCFPMSNVGGGCGSSIWEYPELDALYVDLRKQITPEDMLAGIHQTGDWMYANHLIIPLFFLFPQVGYDPGILQGYEANMLHMGPVRHHEYTKPVYQ